jgi:hypothetical protein
MSTNGYDPALVKQFVNDILRHKEELLSLKGEYMVRAKGVHELIKKVKDVAKESGIPRKALNALLSKIDLEAKIDGLTEGMEEDDEIAFEALEVAFGDFADTPLAAAALDKAEKRKGKNKADLEKLAG